VRRFAKSLNRKARNSLKTALKCRALRQQSPLLDKKKEKSDGGEGETVVKMIRNNYCYI